MRQAVRAPFVVALLVALGLLALANAPVPVARTARAASGQNGQPNQIVAEGYYYDAQTTTPWQSATSSLSPSALTAAYLSSSAVPVIVTGGRPNVTLSVRFSDADASVAVRFAYMNRLTSPVALLGVSDVTTISCASPYPVTDQAGRYCAPNYVLDSAGATHIYVITHAVSAGTYTYFVGTN